MAVFCGVRVFTYVDKIALKHNSQIAKIDRKINGKHVQSHPFDYQI